MKNTTSYCYLIECVSNLHVGSGDNNYGVIDKQVQRDPITQIPVIHSSGLKGALREYFRVAVKLEDELISKYFGSSKTAKDNLQQGDLRILEAHLLSMPTRSLDSNVDFYRATTSEFVEEFNKLSKVLDCKVSIAALQPNVSEIARTEYGDVGSLQNEYIGEKAIVFSTAQMKEMVSHLPVIARNSLDNGQSENLWYEEIMPRESRFYFFITMPNGVSLNYKDEIDAHLDGKLLQIGANATIGYGLCKIKKISTHE
jgi:CRISPR-associated protein Cmr4